MKVKCIEKNRDDKGIIQNYTLVDEKGNQITANAKQIKYEILRGKYDFINLQIDKAGRLVDKAIKKETESDKALDKKKEAFQEIDNFFRNINKLYDSDKNDAYAFTEFLDDYRDARYKSRYRKITPNVKKYIDMLVDEIEKQALADKCLVYLPSWKKASPYISNSELLSKCVLPEKIVQLQQKYNFDYIFIQGLYFIAAENSSNLAVIRLEESFEKLFEDPWRSEYSLLTNSYTNAKKYFDREVRIYALENNMSIENVLTEGFLEVEGTGIERKFFEKYSAEAIGK